MLPCCRHHKPLSHHGRQASPIVDAAFSSSVCMSPSHSRSPPLRPSSPPPTTLETYMGTCASLLQACADRGSLAGGRAVHAHVIKTGVSSVQPISVKLVTMYSSCQGPTDCMGVLVETRGVDLLSWNSAMSYCVRQGNLGTACHLFNAMPRRNDVSWTVMIDAHMKCGRVHEATGFLESNPYRSVVSWTAAINGLVQNGFNCEALVLFCRMLESGLMPNEVTYTSVIRACVGMHGFWVGQSIVGLIVKSGYEKYLSVSNSLITLHIKMQDLDSARRLFEEMEEKDVVSWTAILDVYMEAGELTEARQFFDEMPERNEVSWSTMIARYSQGGNAMEALRLFLRMISDGFRPNVSCFSSVLSASASVKNIIFGSSIHGLVTKIGIRNTVFISSTLIDMYCKCGRPDEGHQVFSMTLEKNVVCWNSMVAGYSSNARFDEAEELFNKIPGKNIISWNGLISGFVDADQYEKVMEIFGNMLLSRQVPNQMTFSSILRACACFSSLEKGKNLHGKIVKLGFVNDIFTGTALTDMYAKSGDVESSKKIFSQMLDKNEVSWAAMIQGLADNGLAEESLILFEDMRRTTTIIPTESLFLSLLSACVHCGLVDKGFHYFCMMKNVYCIVPTERHYTCMVDLLARAGRLIEAEKFINKMPLRPEANTWAALLSACCTYGNGNIGEMAAMKLWELEKQNPSSYILVSNVYASAGRWKDVEKVRTQMRQARLKKSTGCSSVLIRDQFYTFLSWDASYGNAKSLETYCVLELLMSEIKAQK